MLRKLTDLELSKVSGGEGDACPLSGCCTVKSRCDLGENCAFRDIPSLGNCCTVCRKPFSKGEQIVYIYPVYNVIDARTKNFVQTCAGNMALTCNRYGCIVDYEDLKRNVLQVGNIVFNPIEFRYGFYTYNR